MEQSRRHSVFISYSHRDREWLERLQVHVKPLERAGLLDRWDDTRIHIGERWRDEISKGLADADVAVLLISADFLASDFIVSQELPALLAAEQSRGLKLFAVILKPCRLSGTPLADIQTVNSSDRPLIKMSEAEQEAIWTNLSEAIENSVTHSARQDLNTTPSAAIESTDEVLWAIPFEENPFFTGREELLKLVQDRLQDQSRVVLTGLGGVGKTQVAIAYCHRYRERYQYLFWSRASTEQELLSGFVEIARLLGLPEANEAEQSRALEATKRWLNENANWLLILDNATQLELIKELRPKHGVGHLIVTSRSRCALALGVADPVSVHELTSEEAFRFLQRRCGREPGEMREDQAVAELAKELGCLALALEQAAAYITANQARFSDYLRGFRRRRLAVLTDPVAGDYPDSVTTTWALNLHEVAQIPEAADLLNVSAFLGAAPIPLELIARGAPELGPVISEALACVREDPLVIDEALEPLHRYSLVRRDIPARTYSILPIMQTVLLDGMTNDVQQLWGERTVRALHRGFPTPEFENWGYCERLIPHAQACGKLIAKWDFEFIEARELLQKAATYLRRRARFTEATELQQQLLVTCEKSLDAQDPILADVLVNLSKLYRQQGRYQDSENHLQRALEILETKFGSQHPEVGRVLNTFAALYQNMKQSEKAEPLARRALAIWEAELGASHPEIAKTLTNLAVVLRDLGKYQEAENHLRRSIAMEEQLRSSFHPSLAPSLTQLADICRLQLRFSEAEELLRRALSLDEQSLGETHPNVAYGLAGLAELFIQQNRLEEAEKMYRRALELREQALGVDHPSTRDTREAFQKLLGTMALNQKKR